LAFNPLLVFGIPGYDLDEFFSDTSKEGFLLQKGKDSFTLEKIPQGAFELTGAAPGYSTETLIVNADDKALHDKNVGGSRWQSSNWLVR
jgi:hypothetical protein